MACSLISSTNALILSFTASFGVAFVVQILITMFPVECIHSQSCIAADRLFICVLTLKAPITTAADDIHKYFFIVFQRKQDLMFQVNPLLGRGFT